MYKKTLKYLRNPWRCPSCGNKFLSELEFKMRKTIKSKIENYGDDPYCFGVHNVPRDNPNFFDNCLEEFIGKNVKITLIIEDEDSKVNKNRGRLG